MARNKNLTITSINREDAKVYGEKKQVMISDHVLTIDKKFKPTKITGLLREMIKQLDYCRANKINVASLDFTAYGMLLMIKHFTSVGDTIPNDFAGQLKVLEVLIDNGTTADDGSFVNYLEAIVDHFDPSEVEKLAKVVQQFDGNTQAFADELAKLDLKNKDVLMDETEEVAEEVAE